MKTMNIYFLRVEVIKVGGIRKIMVLWQAVFPFLVALPPISFNYYTILPALQGSYLLAVLTMFLADSWPIYFL